MNFRFLLPDTEPGGPLQDVKMKLMCFRGPLKVIALYCIDCIYSDTVCFWRTRTLSNWLVLYLSPYQLMFSDIWLSKKDDMKSWVIHVSVRTVYLRIICVCVLYFWTTDFLNNLLSEYINLKVIMHAQPHTQRQYTKLGHANDSAIFSH